MKHINTLLSLPVRRFSVLFFLPLAPDHRRHIEAHCARKRAAAGGGVAAKGKVNFLAPLALSYFYIVLSVNVSNVKHQY
jgi:hypothetical protein